jgi:hypothetical protein
VREPVSFDKEAGIDAGLDVASAQEEPVVAFAEIVVAFACYLVAKVP